MKLLMISGDRALASGRRGAFYNTLEELHTHFERIDIICPRASVRRYDMVLFGNVYVHPSKWPLAFQPLWIWLEGFRVWKEHRPDLMTVHEYPRFYNGIGARLLHWSTKLPYVLEIMHIPGVPRASGIRERFYRWLTHTFIAWDARRARKVRVINESQAPAFLEAAGIPKGKLVYIPAFYIDHSVFQPSTSPEQILYDIAFVGRMATNKGLGLFLDVVERIGCVAVAVGDGPLLAWARRQAKRRGLKIHFPGFVDDSREVARYLHASRVLLMPSLNEGGPRVILESMACGVPVVATPVGIVPDVLPPECIEEWDSGDMADKVMNILRDAQLYARLREHGLAAVQPYEREGAVRRVADALKEIAAAS